jgi:ribose 5-phosphate isomerase A
LASFHDAIQAMAKDAAKLAEGASVVGLGSGSTAAFIVRELAGLMEAGMEFVPTSLQIKIEAEKNGLAIADESRIPDIDIVFDGADQIDKDFYMIKGGG